MFAFGEPVAIHRGLDLVETLSGGIDPAESRIYVHGVGGINARQGDTATFRGLVRRIVEIPQVWRNPFTGWNAGVVVQVEDAPPLLPDLGALFRPRGARAYDRDTKTVTDARDELWTGPCLVTAATTLGSNDKAVAEQQITASPATVSTGLDLVDVQPDDVLEVTSSRDLRLTTRSLVVVSIANSSTDLVRTFQVIDNQG